MTGTAAIYSPHDDIRLLLRSLLRLHHYQVLREGTSASDLRSLALTPNLTIVVDADLEEIGWSEAVQGLRQLQPDLRILLVTPSRSARTDAAAKTLGIGSVLRRPFAMRQLVEALRALEGPDGGPAVPPSLDPPKVS